MWIIELSTILLIKEAKIRQKKGINREELRQHEKTSPTYTVREIELYNQFFLKRPVREQECVLGNQESGSSVK